MDNMGGISKLYLIKSADILYCGPGEGAYSLGLLNSESKTELPVTQGSASFRETDEDTADGTLFTLEISGKMPKTIPGDALFIREQAKHSLCIGFIDNNEICWLAGYPGAYFDISITKDSGAAHADYNGVALKINVSLVDAAIQVNSFEYYD